MEEVNALESSADKEVKARYCVLVTPDPVKNYRFYCVKMTGKRSTYIKQVIQFMLDNNINRYETDCVVISKDGCRQFTKPFSRRIDFSQPVKLLNNLGIVPETAEITEREIITKLLKVMV